MIECTVRSLKVVRFVAFEDLCRNVVEIRKSPSVDLLKVFDSVAFPGVIAAASRPLTRFDPARGTAMGTNATVRLRSPSGREVRVIASNIGRVRVCSPAGDASVPGYPIC